MQDYYQVSRFDELGRKYIYDLHPSKYDVEFNGNLVETISLIKVTEVYEMIVPFMIWSLKQNVDLYINVNRSKVVAHNLSDDTYEIFRQFTLTKRDMNYALE